MELLLNLLWAALTLLGLGLGWRRRVFARTPGQCDRVPGLVVLSCALILLFPIVSATDDLHAIQPAMEESSSAGRIKQATHDRSACDANAGGTCLAWSSSLSPLLCSVEIRFLVMPDPLAVPNPVQLAKEFGRAPPKCADQLTCIP